MYAPCRVTALYAAMLRPDREICPPTAAIADCSEDLTKMPL